MGDRVKEDSGYALRRPSAPDPELSPVGPSCDLTEWLGGTRAGHARPPRCPAVLDHLAFVDTEGDPTEPVYPLAGPAHMGAAACFNTVGQECTNGQVSNAAFIAPQSLIRSVFRYRAARTRSRLRAKSRLARRRVRANVRALRRHQRRADGPPPGRLVSMSPCRAMAPPSQLVAPLSADALGTAA